LILFECKVYGEQDFAPIVHHVFYRYIYFVRKLQLTYNLEPAGAHGVWGLDEYQFLPFLFGASELIGHHEIKPSSIDDERVLMDYSEIYMYLSCIKHIKQVIFFNFRLKKDVILVKALLYSTQ
jgi:serine/threonine-protein phosphatase 2A activator